MALQPSHHLELSRRSPRFYGRKNLDELRQLSALSPAQRWEIKAVAEVLPFRVNDYVVEQLIDWSKVPDDPMFRLTFPQGEMLEPSDLSALVELLKRDDRGPRLQQLVAGIRARLNPHPAGQLEHNVPLGPDGAPLRGLQHKYRETVLFFPTQGQTCHAYCTYCFRWPQFIGVDELKFAAHEVRVLVDYLRARREITSVLFTGGDPLIMRSSVLRRYIEPLLQPGLEHITSIRIGTKAVAYWPQRFVTDGDADDLLRLFEEVAATGRNLALMAHYSHPRELEAPIAMEAVRRIRSAGAVIRCQAPILRHVNDDARTWERLWRLQVRLGAVPYYMFIARDTGARDYFAVPLARALEIFWGAYRSVSGLARTVRGPSMSTHAGKVLLAGTSELAGERVYLLSLIQARDPAWVGRTFFARYDERAVWFDELQPAFGEPEFFFSEGLRAVEAAGSVRRSLPVQQDVGPPELLRRDSAA